MRSTSNPVFRNLQPQQGGYAGFGQAPGAGQYANNPYGQQPMQYPGGYQQPYQQPAVPTTRPMTIDDVVQKTGITLAVVSVAAIISYALTSANHALALPFLLIGGLGGLVLGLVISFGQKYAPALVLSYAALEGLLLGSFSFLFTNVAFGGVGGSGLIAQAVLGTFGVFFGMLVVYKTGAIRVTPRLTRMVVGALIGVMVLMLGNLVASFFTAGGLGLRSGGTVSIIFSLVVIGVAAFSFLLDFDAADQLIRAQAPEKAAWGVAFGLTVTLVWLYLEILRLLSYFQDR
ncbi:Bax inhibitor-1/YccA family protein [Nocardia sp. CDC160]|uniref:Bax inhibitor-1/YccA family protein n=1 Tax=Nocardia sp. CDC160 TaxID=3112166 RepID=UPI002DC050BA|nr:Bax inhibitor-1/YccA family protein [Nocardia sp. CDC160]MEC3916856.1 Bax inhibitor-1/YccA family protein [Nocardia sp. CDC160]